MSVQLARIVGTGYLVATVALFCGCDQPDGTTDESPEANASTVRGGADDSANASNNTIAEPAPQLEPGAVDADGLVVLREPTAEDDSAEDAEPNSGEGQLADLPASANVASAAERSQAIADDWPDPQAVLFVSGQQHGYIEPCGCTGLENQKGGLIRRDTLLAQLRQRGWELVPVDVGNQVRRTGRQAEIKFQTTVDAFKTMGYAAVTLGIDDLQLSGIELIQMAGSDGLSESPFIAANVSIVDPSFFPTHKVVEAGGRKIGITGVLGQEHQSKIQNNDIEFVEPVGRLKEVLGQLKSEGCDFTVLLAHTTVEESAQLARDVPGFDLVVTAGGFGEPTLRPEPIEGSASVMVQVGTKGMYGGIVGLFDDEQQPIRYQKIAISSQFQDAARMLEKFASYQERIRDAGLEGLNVTPISHPTGRKFVGSEACGDCHTTAYEIWEKSPHVHATEDIIAANNDRGGIARHYDPECISCHVTGWNPQRYYPYTTGYLSLDETPLMVASGCENCHGPGKDHVDAENGDVDVTNEQMLELRQQMVLPLASAQNKCLECHDLDNSPDFHVEGAFEEYWERVKHYGKD